MTPMNEQWARWTEPIKRHPIRTGRGPPPVPTLCANSCGYWRNRQHGRSWRRKGADMLVHTVARRTTDATASPCVRSSLFVGSRGGDPRQRGAPDGQAVDLGRDSAGYPPALAQRTGSTPDQVVGL